MPTLMMQLVAGEPMTYDRREREALVKQVIGIYRPLRPLFLESVRRPR
jgi:hypothetical protein